MPPGDKTLLPLVGKSLLVLALITPEKPEGVKVSVPLTTISDAPGAVNITPWIV